MGLEIVLLKKIIILKLNDFIFLYIKNIKNFFPIDIKFFFFIIFLFNSRAKKILEIKKNFKNLEIENRIKYKKQSQVIFEMFNINENIITFFVWSIYFKNKNKKFYVIQ